jgi:hypothetical protein
MSPMPDDLIALVRLRERAVAAAADRRVRPADAPSLRTRSLAPSALLAGLRALLVTDRATTPACCAA